MGDVPVSTVLVVDDDELLLRSYKRFWSRFFRVVTATTPHEALELADREQPKLAIIDVYLKCNSGLDLARDRVNALQDETVNAAEHVVNSNETAMNAQYGAG